MGGKLMKDEDLHKQLLLDKQMSARIYRQLFSDSQFLEDCDIMDYSLLLGIYYMGIDPKQMGCQESEDGKVDGDESVRERPRIKQQNSIKYMDDEQLNSHFYRKRAETYHTVMREVGADETAIRAQMIEGPGIYYIGVIDILQKWNASKRIERLFKVYGRCNNKEGISCVAPGFYRRRFLKKMQHIGIRPMANQGQEPPQSP